MNQQVDFIKLMHMHMLSEANLFAFALLKV